MTNESLSELRSRFTKNGIVEFICVRPSRREPPISLQSVAVSDQTGLDGDHFNGQAGDARMVTLIQSEHIDCVGQWLGQTIDPALLRRNIVVAGINLLALRDHRFQIGSVVLEGTKSCPPCSRMEENLGEGGYNAMIGHGGINARVIQSGTISIGDPVMVLTDQAADKSNPDPNADPAESDS